MNTDIQTARDVLAKWRKLNYETPWQIDTNRPFSDELVGLFVPADKEYAVKFEDGRAPHVGIARLIVGTAGNPDLLDAIDGILARSVAKFNSSASTQLAAAILAADQRMSA